jgi:hypothetical protein
MIDLTSLPHAETGEYVVYFSNILGSISMVYIMRKDKKAVVERYSCILVGFVEDRFNEGIPSFNWHDNVQELPNMPFEESWAKKQWTRLREAELNG